MNGLPAVFAVSVVIAVALFGCASSKPRQGSGPEPGAVVVMYFHSFAPSTVTIRAGENVRWDNDSIIWHTVTADAMAVKVPADVALPDGAEPFDSGKVEPGNSFSHTFRVPGTYRYVCRPHEGNGMRGTVVVRAPAATLPAPPKDGSAPPGP
jgi:plastocyanin